MALDEFFQALAERVQAARCGLELFRLVHVLQARHLDLLHRERDVPEAGELLLASGKFRLAARMAMRTSPADGSGVGNSFHVSASTPTGFSQSQA